MNKNKMATLLLMITVVTVLAIGTVSGDPQTEAMSWNVKAGGQTADMAIQGMGFYPGIITVNVGDTIKWKIGGNFHTISFLSGQTPPPDGSPASLAPHGGSKYNGTGFVSSGILPTGGSYSLKFTKPGIFAYRCLLHAGMQGVVIVQKAGSSYPFTNTEYRKMGQQDLEKDIKVGKELAKKVMHSITSSPGPGHTTNWQTFIDIPLPEITKVELKKMGDSNVKGNAILNVISPAKMNVKITASGLVPNSKHLANIKVGNCDNPGSTVFSIGNFKADSKGNALFVKDISVSPPFGIMNNGWIVNIDKDINSAKSLACGNVVKHDAAFMRFASRTLTIDQGDTVKWTQLNPMEIHTVSILAANQLPPDVLLPGFIINPLVAGPSGTNMYNGSGYFNSGILIPGTSYSLKFTKPGTFKYLCLIHDEMNMIGYIKVRPKS